MCRIQLTIAHHLCPGWLAPLGAFTANFYVFFSYRLIGKPRNTAAFSGCQRKPTRILSDTNARHYYQLLLHFSAVIKQIKTKAQLRVRPERKDGGHPALCNAPPQWLRMRHQNHQSGTKVTKGTRGILLWHLGKVGLIFAKAAALRINISTDGSPVAMGRTHITHTSHASRLLSSSLSLHLLPPRSRN